MSPGPLDSGEPDAGERLATLEAALSKSLRVITHLEEKLAAPAGAGLSAPIAVVGMACRFPGGANDPDSFWQLLEAGTDVSGPVPADRWPGGPKPRGYFLDRVPYGLDDRLFRLAPEEVRSLDPQQRLLLELAWEGFEDAGIPQARFGGSRTGVFIGAEKSDFMRAGLYSGDPARIGPYTATGVALSAAAGRLAYMFDLQGPCTALDAACASSLVALDQACASLRRGACDMALAGAVSLMLAPEPFAALDRLGALSADGRCKTFAAAADGYARGEGGAVLVLRPLEAALAAGDRIHGVILGSAVRHGGRSNGLTAPNQASQEAVIRAALADAGVEPAAIDLIEAHGTGTPLGDPIEMAALEAVFGTSRAETLHVGSVKTNLGHLETAAGMAGVVKLLLCLRHGVIARHLHLDEPSRHIPWESLPVAVPVRPVAWPRRDGRRRIAGVSAFGFTGTVAHVVVAEPPAVADAPAMAERPWHAVTVSGRSAAALTANMAALATVDAPIGNVAWSANTGRTAFEHRAVAVVRDGAALRDALGSAEVDGPSLYRAQVPGGEAPRIAFAFTGQGAQFSGMGRGLYESAPVFRDVIDRCADGLHGHLDVPLRDLLFGAGSLDDTAHAQPALFAMEVALAALWQSWGIRPALVLGHSVGEFAAAHVAGVLPLEDALALVAARGRLVRTHAPAGAMAVVFAGWDRVESVLRAAGVNTREAVVAAALNAPACITIAGAPEPLSQALDALRGAGIGVKPLAVSHAFHAPLLRPVVAPFRDALAKARLSVPVLPVISGMTGQVVAPAELATADYWCRHLLQPVRFADAVGAVTGAGIDCVVEIGPQPVLTGLARQAGAEGWLPSLSGPGAEWLPLLGTLARLHLRGAAIDWQGVDAGRTRRRVSLPTYRFQRKHEPDATFAAITEGFAAITRFGRDRLRVAIARMGLAEALHDTPDVATLRARLGVVPAYARLFAWIADILDKDGGLHVEAAAAESVEALAARHPEMAAMGRLLAACLDAYPEVLRGVRNPIEILFPGGSMDLVESVYQTGAVSEHFNRLMAREVSAAAAGGARIIEIGAGTGGTTQAVLPALAGMRVRYACTDVSPAFVRRLQERFGAAHAFTEFATLDIERDVAAQGFDAGGYDVVVAANVLHATRDIVATLRQAARLLRPGGRLVLNEVTRAHECVGLTFGLTPGWWLYEDAAIRLPHAPVLDVRGWRVALAAAGLGGMQAYGLEGDDMDMPVQAVMVSRRGDDDAVPAQVDLSALIKGITGVTIAPQDAGTNLFELGLDSLLLMQVKQGIAREFGVEIEMGQFYAALSTPAKLAAHVARHGVMPAEPAPTVQIAAPPVVVASQPVAPAPAVTGDMARIVEQQIALMQRQLELLAGAPAAAAPPAPPPAVAAPLIAPPAPRVVAQPSATLGPRQQRFIADLVQRYTAKTARSKTYAAAARHVLADWIATIGFRPELKEMIYPIVSEGSQGSHLRDIDGNDYVDLAMGFGVGFFGHSPPFVMDALRTQMERGFELATQSALAAENARLISEMTGCERVVFSNTGTEAVMTAFRLARTVTGRRRVAHFKSAFHGFYDGVMAVSAGGAAAVPMVPGIVPNQVEDVLVLDYGDPASLRALEAVADTLAGVLVEPVQSRNPDLQPREFLHELRRMTERHGIALIFDELINGFRIAPGGAQQYFDVTADIVTYGKMIGGGMPVSIIAGKARFLDAIDGGAWQFGDDSRPAATMTFFGGTFCRHPLSMASTNACLRYMRDQGPALQEGVNRRTAELAGRLDAVFRAGRAPFRVAWFASQFQLRHRLPAGETFQSLELALFFFLLLEKGIYSWERRVCFLSIAHTDADLDRVVEAARKAVAELRAAGFFGDAPPPEDGPQGGPGRLALTPSQRDMAFRAARSTAAATAFAEPVVLELRGAVDAEALQGALDAVVARHDALRMMRVAGDAAVIAPRMAVPIELRSMEDLPGGDAVGWLEALCRQPFDLQAGPLLRAGLLRLAPDHARLVLVLHHLAADGWSAGVVLQELAHCYGAALAGRTPNLPPAVPIAAYIAWYTAVLSTRSARAQEYWREQLADAPPLALPSDALRPARRSFAGGRLRRRLGAGDVAALKAFCKAQRCSSFTALFATWSALLARLSGQRRFVVAVAGAGQSAMGVERLVGQCAAMLPFPVAMAPEEDFAALLARLGGALMRLWDHQDLRPEDVAEGFAVPPLRVGFNQDRDPGGWEFVGATAELGAAPIGFVKYELFLNAVETGEALLLDLDYDADLFSHHTAAAWMDLFVAMLRERLADVGVAADALPAVAAPRSMESVATPVLARIRAQPGERAALIRDGAAMSYAELWARLDAGLPVPVGRPWIAAFSAVASQGAGFAAHVEAWIADTGLVPGSLLRLSDGVLGAAGLDAWAAPLAAGATIVTGAGGPDADAVLLIPGEAKAWSGSAATLLLLDDGTLLEAALADLQRRLPETVLRVVTQPAGCVVSLGVTPVVAAGAASWRRIAVRPVAALDATVRDAQGRAVPPGAEGVMHLAGSATGSAARQGADGRITLLAADAVAVLLAHPAVQSVAVEAQGLRVQVGDSGVSATTLRRHLLRRLPAERLPAALAIGAGEWETGVAATALPPTTEAVVALFRSVLRQDVVGAEDDFFDLGGDSLAAAQLVNGLRAQFGLDLPQQAVFEAPTPATLAALLGDAGAPASPIPLLPRTEALPLSAAQRRLWFLDQLGRDGDAYVMGVALRIGGPLDVAALQAALTDLAMRHETLRTGFPLRGDVPVQAIRDAVTIDLPLRDATEATLEALLAETPGFDLAQDLPLRAVLYRLAPQSHVLALHLHHIAGDGWSLAPLARDLATAYAARRTGTAPDFVPLAAQYTDVAAWQDGGELAAQEAFWRAELADLPMDLSLPYDRPHGRADAPRPAGRAPLRVDAALAARLRDLAHEEQASLFMVLQAALSTLLMRYGAGEDIPLGAPIANRRRAEAEPLVGFFVNTLVLRCRLDGAPSFRALVRRLRSADLAAFAQADLPYERVVDMLRPQRGTDAAALFQVLLMLGQDETQALPLPGLRTRLVALPTRHAKFDLAVAFTEALDGGLDGSIEYDASRFLPETAAQLAAHLSALLAAAVAQPDVAVQRLRFLSPAEQRALLAQAGEGVGAEVTVTALLAEQAAATPDATALVAADGTRFSYAALHAAADTVAGRLAARGIGPGARVAVVWPRTADLVISILGVLKAGAAYVPIDPAYPNERIALLLEDAAPAAVLRPGTMPAGAVAPVRAPAPGDTAYVIYTSGSTGRPKGVVLSHRAVASYLCWARDAYRTREGNGAPINTSIGFDATVTSLFLPLISGTAVHLLPAADELEALAEALRRVGDFSLVKLTPAHLDILAALLPPESLAGQARALVIGGEALPAAAMRAWRRHAPATRLINEYGPTEATVGCVVHEVGAETPDDGAVPIGRPTGNARVYLLDAALQPVPAGAVGEIYIGGAGVADGYLNRPELTTERFLADPFLPGGRMYRSGDLARRRADGVLLYLGRADGQIKLRGHRIEPGEIEATMLALPGVAQAAVALRRDATGDAVLAGFLVASEGAEVPTLMELRAALQRALPAAMVPAELVWLPRLPLSPNGKVDRARLASPRVAEAPQPPAADATVPALCDAFGGILERPALRPGDDFFALGGHSLLAAQLVNRLRPRFPALRLGDLFAAPTPAGLAARLAAPRAEAAPPLLRRMPDAADHPVSANQRRLWILDRLEPGRSSYNILGALELRGTVDAARLRTVLSGLMAQHEILRSAVVAPAGEPRQRVLNAVPPPLTEEDLSTAADPLEAARALLEREALAPIALASAPLWRARLLRLGSDRALLALNLHHAIADGWSLGVLLRDFAALWDGRALPPLQVQYRDFAAWQAECLAAPPAQADRDWWVAQLRGADGRLDLRTDRPRGRGTSGRGAQAVRRLDVAGLQRLAEAAGTTLFPVQLALVAAVLHRYTGRTDLVLGTVAAGRDDAALHDAIGFFANTLALRLTLRPEEPVAELVRRTGATVAEALRHAATPFDSVVEALGAPRESGRTPIFDVLVAREPALDLPRLKGLRVTPFPIPVVTRHFDLALYFRDTAEGIDLVAEYDSDLFDAWRIEALCGHIANLAAATDTAARLDALDMLAPAERQHLLHGLSGHATDYPRDTSIVALFREQAALRPDAEAVRHAGGATMRYAELDAASDRIAACLAAEGVVRGELVGIAATRSTALVAGILGILKAGAAYVPIDPDYPAARIASMLQAAPIGRVLTDATASRLPAALRRIDLDGALRHGGAAPAAASSADDLAYVMFTSGSTGLPKAVAVPHRAVVRLVVGTDYVSLGPDERLLQTGAISFDAATFEIWGMLLHGGLLVLAEPRALLDAEAVKPLIADHAITTMWLTSSLFNHFVDSDPTLFAPLRQLLVGGERLSPPHVAELRRRFPALRLLNGYGPTENTTFSCVHPIDAVVPEQEIPIGRPIANSRAWILGPGDQPAPIGVPGEIVVGGDGLALGYLGRDDLTAERFVPHPLLPDQRIYRTGDFGCWLPDGAIAYLGRRDRQVKVRGVRIEIGEVEAALLALPGVARAAVTARQRHGVTELVGYLVGPSQAENEALRAVLRDRLPPALVPAHLISVAQLPIDPNGKLDYAALPQPESRETPAGRAPRNALETALCGIWAAILGRDGVGVDDNFFELGGHSLLATRLVDRIRDELGLPLELRDVFAEPTVAGLAAHLLTAMLEARRAPSKAPEIPALPSAEDYPASSTQRRLWFLHRLQGGSAAYNITGAWRLRGALDAPALQRAFAQLVERHEALRTVFVERDGEPRQRVLPALPPLPKEDTVTDAGAACATEAAHVFDLAQPLLRARLLRVAPDDAVLLVNCHHMIADGESMQVMQEELAQLYAAARSGQPAALPAAVAYKDAAAWQAARADSTAARDWWRTRLAEPAPELELPTDFPRPPRRDGCGAVWRTALPAAVVAGRGTTPFVAAVALVAALLARISGQDEIAIGTAVANRDVAALRGVVGFFADTVPLRCRVDAAAGFDALLDGVAATVTGTLSHPLPFDALVALTGHARDASRSPLFDVMVTLADVPAAPALPGIAATPLRCAEQGVQFDLTFRFLRDATSLHLDISYATDLFTEATIQRMAGWLTVLAEASLAAPDLPVGRLPLLRAAEQPEFADGAALDVPRDTLVALFEAQVDRTPDHLAVSAERDLDYRALDGLANALAAALIGAGVVRGDRVGLALPSSTGLIVGMLGILKAGAAYVPLDPAQPEERRQAMAADACCRCVVGEGGLALPEAPLAQRAYLPLAADDLAYVIFTSGSTGRPKGVMVQHGAVVNLAHGLMAALPGDAPRDVAVIAAPVFDASVQQIFPALLRGDALHPVPPALKRNPAVLLRFLADRAIAVADGTPTLLDLLLEAGLDHAALPHLRHLVLGGETLRADALLRLRGNPALSRLTVHNAYGPTECTVDTTLFSLPPKAPVPDPVPIGRPLPNVRVQLLNAQGEAVPQGVAGEICITGAGLARGYCGGTAEDAARFTAQRLYRTGDRGRSNADGQLIFLGRRDGQIKLRGHRIEAGEVEAAMLARIPGAKQAAVLVQGSGAEAVLVGWVASDAALNAEAARDALARLLPDYMVPSRLAALPALPLTPSGKIDRRALAALPMADAAPPDAAPQDAVEAQVAAIWAEVLGREGIGRRQNFFALGGHSLGVLRVLARVEQRLGVAVPVAAFYGAPTVADLARAIAVAPPQQELTASSAGGDFALSPAQRRLWLIAELQPDATGYAMPAAFVLDGALDMAALSRAASALQARHESLRSVFIEVAGEPRQRVLPPAAVTLQAEAVASLAEAERIAAAEVARPFDLAAAPPLRWRLLRLAAESHLLLVNLHHIIGDGASLAILARELGALYDAFSAGAPDPLPPLRMQYRDAVTAMAARHTGPEAEAWWRAQFAAPPPTLSLATDTPRGVSPAGPGGIVPAAMPDGIVAALRHFAAAQDSTPFAVVLALLARLLHEASGDRDIVIGIPVSGRFRAEFEDQVGLYAETLPIRIAVYPEEPFDALHVRVAATLRMALSHEGFGFDALMEAVDPPMQPGRSPFFDVMLAWQVAGAVPLSLAGIGVRPFALPMPGAQFDLCFSVLDAPEGMALSIVHRSDLFGTPRVAALGAQLVALAARLLGAPPPDDDMAPRLLRVWEDVLGRGGIGLDTPFVEAGGHSLKAARLVARMQQEFGRTLRLREVFAHPTVRAQAALLAGATAPAPVAVPAAPAPEILPPASAGQRRIWALSQLADDPAVYAIGSVLHLDGALDEAALLRALRQLVARHEALRTVFAAGPDGLRQRILPADALSFLRDAVEPLRFDLANGPLFQVRLLREHALRHRLEITLHHAIGDGWSVRVLSRELGALYAGERLPALPLQYRDFAARQAAWLDGAGGAAARQHWHAALAGDLPVLHLPADRPRPALQTFRGALHAARLDAAALDALCRLAAASGTSLFAVLLAAVQVVLHRYSGQEDIVIGTPVSGRVDADLEDQVGLYVNTLALRMRAAADTPFATLLARVHETLSGGLEHQSYPFDRLVEELGVQRDPSRSPLFDVFVAMQEEPAPPPILDGLAVRVGDDTGGIAKLDLSLHWRVEPAGLGLWLEYNTDLFDAPRIARMAGHLLTVLHAAPDAADRAIGRMPLMTPAEEAAARRWTALAQLPPAPTTLLDAFAQQVAQAPDRLAVRDAQREMSYAALDRWANGIAASLLALGLARGDRVAVLLPRSAALPAAMLGIWKAGLVLVPMDAAQPQARRDLLLADAGCRAIIGDGGTTLPALDPARVVPLDSAPTAAAAADDTAYILYTSGSTGTPKGVRIAHRNLAAFAPVLCNTFGMQTDDVVLALTTISFDIALLELVCPLAHGMAVAVADDAACADPAATLAWLRDSGATVLQATPSRLSLLLRERGGLGAVRRVLVGGERLPPELAAALRVLPVAAINVYGPTETTIWSTAEPIGNAPPGIGWALPGEAALILSSLGEEQPVGVPGEIAIAGGGVGLGYLGRSELTAERFAPLPDSTPCYRTGDRGVRRADGGIDFLGRTDDQVKLHGFRIEPGEVEAALRAHPAVQDAAVAVRPLRGQPELVAYVTGAMEEAALRAHLLARLPRHMVPAVFVQLPAMPLLPSGKIDRKALPAPAEANATEELPDTANATEQAVLLQWRRVLVRAEAGLDDDFFDSGGHSLRAAELANLLQAALSVAVSLRDLFLFTTPRRLAAELGRRGTTTALQFARAPDAAHHPLSRAQRRLFALDRMQPGSTAQLIAGAFRLDGVLDAAALARALDATVARHESLRTAFHMVDGEPRQVIVAPPRGLLRLDEVADAAEAEAICAAEAEVPFDLAQAPLLRARLLRLAPERHVLAFAVHHIVADGVSLGLILDDLEQAYCAARDGTSPLLPPADFQYRDHVAREAAVAETQPWRASRGWWLQQLAGELPVLDLPAARPRPARAGGAGGAVPFAVDAATTAGLEALARSHGATPFMVLLAAGAALFHRLTGAADMVIGSVSGHRGAPELSGVVGCFVNPLPLRLSVPPRIAFTGLLRHVRDVVFGAVEHADYPFDALVRDLRAGGDPSRTPLFDIGFSWNALPHVARQSFAGCAMTPFATPAPAAKYDLLLIAAPDGGRIQGVAEYAAALFDTATVQAMLRRLGAILAQVADAPDTALDLLDLGEAPPATADVAAPIIELQF